MEPNHREKVHGMIACGGVYGDGEIDAALDGLLYAVRDGQACVVCGTSDGAMRPAGNVLGCQVFVHETCDVRGR